MQRSASAAVARLLLGLGVFALLAGCQVQRTMIITSTPPGAEVRLDDELIGQTPLDVPFVHYGTRRLTFYRPGYLTRSEVVEVSPPWYGRFPVDLITEVLVPIGWRDDHPIHVDLTSGAESRSRPAQRSVFERAEILRRAGPDGPRSLPPSDPEDTPPPGASSTNGR